MLTFGFVVSKEPLSRESVLKAQSNLTDRIEAWKWSKRNDDEDPSFESKCMASYQFLDSEGSGSMISIKINADPVIQIWNCQRIPPENLMLCGPEAQNPNLVSQKCFNPRISCPNLGQEHPYADHWSGSAYRIVNTDATVKDGETTSQGYAFGSENEWKRFQWVQNPTNRIWETCVWNLAWTSKVCEEPITMGCSHEINSSLGNLSQTLGNSGLV